MPKGDRDITVVRRTPHDKLSTTAPVDDETVGEVKGVFIMPRRALETDRGWVTIEGYTIWIMPTSQGFTDGMIRPTDLIDIDGTKWQVDGPPGRFTKKGDVYTEVQVKKVGAA